MWNISQRIYRNQHKNTKNENESCSAVDCRRFFLWHSTNVHIKVAKSCRTINLFEQSLDCWAYSSIHPLHHQYNITCDDETTTIFIASSIPLQSSTSFSLFSCFIWFFSISLSPATFLNMKFVCVWVETHSS